MPQTFSKGVSATYGNDGLPNGRVSVYQGSFGIAITTADMSDPSTMRDPQATAILTPDEARQLAAYLHRAADRMTEIQGEE